jgi:hypothetical protein
MYSCLYCPREFKNTGGLACHQPYCKENPNRVQRPKSPNAHARKGSIPWNKGLIGDPRLKHTDESILKLKEKANGRALTPEKEEIRKQKIREKARLNNGGYRQGSGRGKKGWYKGFFCDSSYELAYVMYCVDHGIDIKRNTEKRQYFWNNKVMNYIPDFIVQGHVIEIKGYKTEQWDAKLKANPDVTVLYEKDLTAVFNYVVNKYGKNYIELYEGK